MCFCGIRPKARILISEAATPGLIEMSEGNEEKQTDGQYQRQRKRTPYGMIGSEREGGGRAVHPSKERGKGNSIIIIIRLPISIDPPAPVLASVVLRHRPSHPHAHLCLEVLLLLLLLLSSLSYLVSFSLIPFLHL